MKRTAIPPTFVAWEEVAICSQLFAADTIQCLLILTILRYFQGAESATFVVQFIQACFDSSDLRQHRSLYTTLKQFLAYVTLSQSQKAASPQILRRLNHKLSHLAVQLMQLGDNASMLELFSSEIDRISQTARLRRFVIRSQA